ncbi:LysR substrate-binding domain-containing protein [Oceanospirillum sediminis]|uniref:LysR family transcriptional regulator n=1 Tax=Oceanospirillum sediminis TaxID=2760088 RepID=A0A839IRL9_9GAMM|nr:LysR substrate-binding domain-containing protein [Oceanospirillum sediminis]MBB1487139.1 LysR family transcriptional regulator [Oceanospirillum sediminis]
MMLKARTLTALRTFEAVGRRMSFSAAACELCVTTGAVSQQVRKLEEELGKPLFIRRARSLELTPEGDNLLQITRQSLRTLSQAVAEIQQNAGDSIITLTVIPSLAFHWLIPRLADFHRRYPGIRVEVKAVPDVIDSASEDSVLVIDYSPEADIPGWSSRLLMKEYLLPVIAPDYLAGRDWSLPDSWQQVALLHDTQAWPDAGRHAEWAYWLQHIRQSQSTELVHIPAIDEKVQHYYFNRVDMAVEAAAAGLGVAMARKAVLTDLLDKGRLQAPFPAVPSPARYYLRQRAQCFEDKTASLLIDWLSGQVL